MHIGLHVLKLCSQSFLQYIKATSFCLVKSSSSIKKLSRLASGWCESADCAIDNNEQLLDYLLTRRKFSELCSCLNVIAETIRKSCIKKLHTYNFTGFR